MPPRKKRAVQSGSAAEAASESKVRVKREPRDDGNAASAAMAVDDDRRSGDDKRKVAPLDGDVGDLFNDRKLHEPIAVRARAARS